MIRRPFATTLERADTMETAGLNWAHLHSTRPVKSCSHLPRTSSRQGLPLKPLRLQDSRTDIG
jgi:hypothetical protein